MQMLSATLRSCIAGQKLPTLSGELHVVPYLDTSVMDVGSTPRVLFFLESHTLPQRAFQISLFPGADGDGHIEVAASGLQGFRLAMDAVRQLLVHHGELDVARGVVSMPAGTLEEGGDTTRAAALYLDFWKLPAEAVLDALNSMQSWRVSQVFVPVPSRDLWGSAAEHTLLLVQLRRACIAAGVELVPVLRISLQSALSLDSTDSQEENQQLFELLPVFGPLRLLGVRFETKSPHDEEHGSDAQHEDQILAGLTKIRKIGLSNGTANLACWLPVEGLPFLRRFCKKVSSSSARGRTTVVLEVDVHRVPQGSGAASLVHSIGPAALTCRSYGLPHLVFASTANAASTEQLPTVVWPGEGVRAYAALIGSVMQASQEACARGTVVEVPVHTSPWCGQGTRFIAAWCGLSALFGSSLVDPEAVLAVLDDPERQTTERGGSLGQLLAAHLLKAPCGRKEVLVAAPAFARLLWDSPVQARSTNGGPSERFLPTLLQLLQGRFQGGDAKPQLVSNANA
eukprot:1648640-Amphidinium_carterae.1